jgi:hypothetical protein
VTELIQRIERAEGEPPHNSELNSALSGYFRIISLILYIFRVTDKCMSYLLQIKDQNNQAVITVPKNMRNAKEWEDGQELEWKINDKGNLELEEV